jgi:hypothetical protein
MLRQPAIREEDERGKKGMCTVKRMAILLLSVLLLTACSGKEKENVFIRIDRDDPNAWREELANVRFLKEERMSGSAQFSETQFLDLAERLKDQAEEVWIVDCRLESHGLMNGMAVSWCGEENGANIGKTVEEVEAEEASFSSLTGRDITAYTAEKDRPKDPLELTVEKWETERQLVENEDMHYLRLACPDHCWPPGEVIDAFIDFADGLEEEAWLHFHCQAGSGRTGAFMTIYEMMQKPEASAEEILRHQAETGSGNLLDRAAPEKSHEQKERCVLARAVYQYIRENSGSGYAVKWSSYLADHSHTEEMLVGERLGGEGFSSDPLVVTDSLEAAAAGRATVLAGEDIYFITVKEK